MEFNSPILRDFDPKEWSFLGLWKEDLFSACFWQSYFNTETVKALGLDLPHQGTFSLTPGNIFYSKKTREALRAQMRKFLAEDSDFFARYAKAADDAYVEGIAFAKGNGGAEAAPEKFEKLLIHARRMMLFWAISATHLFWILEDAFQAKATDEGVPLEKLPQLVPQIRTPLYYQQQELRVLNARFGNRSDAELREDAELMQELERHRKEYGWIEIANWIGDELTMERLIEQVRHASGVEESESPHVSAEFKKIADCFGKIAYAKQAGAEYQAIFAYHLYPFLHRIVEKLGISYREMMHLNHDEVLKGLRGDVPQAELKRLARARETEKWVVLTDMEGRAITVEDLDDIATLESLIPRPESGTSELKGQIGNKGIARGHAKVVMNLDEFSKMEAGDVLITTMTTPDFVILMQKSAAIVTDIGGLLSHAAIMSREMKKPCIIGTKFATQVFKDGDLLIVDADTGVVKKLA